MAISHKDWNGHSHPNGRLVQMKSPMISFLLCPLFKDDKRRARRRKQSRGEAAKTEQ